MQERATDALEMLLPDAAPQFWQRAQKVTTFLRLLSGEARGQGGTSIALSLARARGEFERSATQRAVRLHEELLRHHLYALVGPDAFAHFGECENEPQAAWSELEDLRGDATWVPHVPAPGEGAAQVAGRLLAGLERAGAGASRLELWRARLARATGGPQAGAAAFEALLARLDGAAPARAPSSVRAQALAGLVECQLDRAAVRAARARLEAEGTRALSDPRLRRLLLWTRALLGDDAGARTLAAAAGPARGRLPRPLAELRARAPEKAAWFSGQVQGGEPPACDATGQDTPEGDLQQAAARARAELGAALFAVWVLEGPARARLAAHAVAPAHRGRWAAWREAREGACADPAEREFRLVGDGRACIEHFAPPAQSAAHTIDPAAVLSAALFPLRDARGEVCGWLDVELEHHLVASVAHLERLAAAWRACALPDSASVASAPAPVAAPADEDTLAAAVLRGFVDGLALKTAQRRWSAFEVRAGKAHLVAGGGGALESAEGEAPPRAESRAVARALATGRSVAFEDSTADLALHPDAESGVAVPLELRGKVAGVWLVESTRRRDFAPADVRRFEARAREVARELSAARFRSWHAARFGHDVHVETERPVAGLSQEQLVALALSRTHVALSGPLGSGRRLLARRLHFEGRHPDAPFRRLAADVAGLERAFADAGAGASLVLERVESLAGADQVLLARLCEERAGDPRVFLLLEEPLSELAQRGALVPELAWCFAKVELRVAPLAQRRHEIPPLARLFAARFAAEERVRTPRLDDTAAAFLWRQPWTGNVRELAQWMYRLVLCHPAEAVDDAALDALAARLGHATLKRLPSRHPDRALLLSALESTATGKGSWNKTRAALYLGWDTDTLQSRMMEAGLWNAGGGAPDALGADSPPSAPRSVAAVLAGTRADPGARSTPGSAEARAAGADDAPPVPRAKGRAGSRGAEGPRPPGEPEPAGARDSARPAEAESPSHAGRGPTPRAEQEPAPRAEQESPPPQRGEPHSECKGRPRSEPKGEARNGRP